MHGNFSISATYTETNQQSNQRKWYDSFFYLKPHWRSISCFISYGILVQGRKSTPRFIYKQTFQCLFYTPREIFSSQVGATVLRFFCGNLILRISHLKEDQSRPVNYSIFVFCGLGQNPQKPQNLVPAKLIPIRWFQYLLFEKPIHL